MIGPYIFCFLIQSGKVRPNHKSETSDGDVSSVAVVLNILVYMGISISCKYARRVNLLEMSSLPRQKTQTS